MKLRNKKTGEIGEFTYFNSHIYILVDDELKTNLNYNSLADLNEEWEDYEVPKEFWYIGQDGVIFSDTDTITQDYADRLQAIGNYFESEEEAEKAVEKLKAWKRLKDKGIRFKSVNGALGIINFTFDNYCSGEPHSAVDDLELLFGRDE